MSKVLVIAPHPDDELLGCGGTILRHVSKGDSVDWMIVTNMNTIDGYAEHKVNARKSEINLVSKAFSFAAVHELGFSPTKLDTIPLSTIINSVAKVIADTKPEIVYLPFNGDVHSDHGVVFDAAAACMKWFRYPSIRRVLCYETISETDFSITPDKTKFHPNVFVDISEFIDKKLSIASIYSSEMGEFPFPRSYQAIKSLAEIRGVASGVKAAESFMLLREIIND